MSSTTGHTNPLDNAPTNPNPAPSSLIDFTGLVNWLFEIDKPRDDFWACRGLLIANILSIFYLMVAVGYPIGFAIWGPDKVTDLKGYWRIAAVIAGLFVSTGHPAWFWIEARGFDDWLNKKYPGDAKSQEPFRDSYQFMSEHVKAFWTGLLGLYAALLFAAH